MDTKIPLIVIAGPTASGKTKLAVSIAKHCKGEVVSADSMQIYQGLNIATAKPTEEEMQGVRHHLIDFAPPEKPFSVAEYVKLAGKGIEDIYSRSKMPILCGGTGLYISSLINNVRFDESSPGGEIRERLSRFAESEGKNALWLRLKEIDPDSAAAIHENNVTRVIRALEVWEQTGIPFSRYKQNAAGQESNYKSCIIAIGFKDRQVLYDRINRRVDQMVENGLLDEVRDFYFQHTPATANQAIGYKELVPYIRGDTHDLDACIEKIKQETRRYAKRQLTWFRRVDGINWVYADEIGEYENFLEKVKNIIAKSEILCYNIS